MGGGTFERAGGNPLSEGNLKKIEFPRPLWLRASYLRRVELRGPYVRVGGVMGPYVPVGVMRVGGDNSFNYEFHTLVVQTLV